MEQAVIIERPADDMRSVSDQDGNVIAQAPAITWLTLRSGLKLEVKCPGMQLTRGASCSARVKKLLGLPRGMRKAAVLVIMNEICDQIVPAQR